MEAVRSLEGSEPAGPGFCPSCGEKRSNPTARFCGSCGTAFTAVGAPVPSAAPAVPSAPTAPAAPAAVAPAGQMHGGWVAKPETKSSGGPSSKVIGAALVAFLVLAVGIFEFYSLDSKLGKSNRTLTSTQTQLASARSDLAKVQASLQAANSKVRTLTKARDNLISSLHQTKAKLAKALSNLRGAKNNLSQAKNQIALQGGQIQTLKTCLGGVSVALNDVLNFNYNGAANALVSVESACQSAFQLLRS